MTSEEGEHDMIFRVTLMNYDITFNEAFTITVTECTIHSLEVEDPDPSAYTYHIQTNAAPIAIPFPVFTYSHTNCPGGDYNGLTFEITDYSWASIVDETIEIQE